MKYQFKPGIVFIIIAVILGSAIYRQFDFESMKFEKQALVTIYAIAFIMSIIFMFKKSGKIKKENSNKDQ